MFPWLAETFSTSFGPLRLFSSTLFLIGSSAAVTAVLTFWLLPRLWHFLPTGRGRAHAVDADKSIGKPVSAGLLFIPIFIATAVLFTPPSLALYIVLGCTGLHMVLGYIDDRIDGGLSELQLGAADLVIAAIGAAAICGFNDFPIWLPLFKDALMVAPWLFISVGTGIIWLSINATNCTDGVDGLSGSLSALALMFLGGILYAVVGHEIVSSYLLVPHYANGADWALLAFQMVGCLAGYLWYNSYPSLVLMGDAGSRPIGFLIGVLVLVSGNPFLLIVVAAVVLANGATGLLKVALLRFFRIRIFHNVRYPLHDHVRHKLGWSATQVLVRFVLLQAMITPVVMVLLIKVR